MELTNILNRLTVKEKEALKEAVTVIWLDDNSDYINGLWDVIAAITGQNDFGIDVLYQALEKDENTGGGDIPVERLARLEREFAEAASVEDFGEERMEEVFRIANHLQSHLNWLRTKPRKEDVQEIARLKAEIEKLQPASEKEGE